MKSGLQYVLNLKKIELLSVSTVRIEKLISGGVNRLVQKIGATERN